MRAEEVLTRLADNSTEHEEHRVAKTTADTEGI